jgi:hypothetical protein
MDEQEIKAILERLEKTNKAAADSLRQAVGQLKKAGMDPRVIAQQAKELKANIKNLQLTNKEQEDYIDTIDKVSKSQEKLAKASQDLEAGFYKNYRAIGLNTEQALKASEQHKAVSETLGRLGKAVETGSGRIDDYTSAFQGRLGGFGNAISSVGTNLQSNVDIYRTLSSVGASFGQNLVTLRETAASAGLPLEDFAKLVKDNSQNLAALFGSTTQGAVQFSKLSEQFRRTNIDVLAPLGFTVDEINDTLLTNLTLQRRAGIFIEGADQQQIESARSLALELDKLSKLTGQQRSALLKGMESQLNNERFLAFLGSQTDETRQRLQSFAASVGGLAPGLAEGFQDLIANAGVPVTAASRSLIQNIPDATAIVKQLTDGTLSTTEAMVQLRDASKRSTEVNRAIAQTGTVDFARLYGEVTKLATAKLDENAVTEEAVKRQNALTVSLTQFQDASKRLSAGFQSLETGFYAFFGDIIGKGTSGLSSGIKELSTGLNALPTPIKALLHVGTTLSKWIYDKATQIAIVYSGTYGALKASGVGPGSGLGGGGSGFFGGKGEKMGRAASIGARAIPVVGGGLSAVGDISNAFSDDPEKQKAGKAGLAGGAGGAALGAAIGSIIPGVGTLVGGALGYMLGSTFGPDLINSRATGTLGETGLPFEAKTSMLKVHAGERVLNAQETVDYNKSGPDAGQTQHMAEYNQTAKELLEATKATNALLNKQVAIAMATEKNTKKTSKVVDKVGPSIV